MECFLFERAGRPSNGMHLASLQTLSTSFFFFVIVLVQSDNTLASIVKVAGHVGKAHKDMSCCVTASLPKTKDLHCNQFRLKTPLNNIRRKRGNEKGDKTAWRRSNTGQHFLATCRTAKLYCKLKSVLARITTPVARLQQHVAQSRIPAYFAQHVAAATCNTGAGNTRTNPFQLAMQHNATQHNTMQSMLLILLGLSHD